MKKKISSVVLGIMLCAGVAVAGQQSTEDCCAKADSALTEIQIVKSVQDQSIEHFNGNINALNNRVDGKQDKINTPFYVKALVQYNMVSDMDEFAGGDTTVESDDGYGGIVGIGKKINNFQVGVDLSMQKTDIKNVDSGDIKLSSAMLVSQYNYPVYNGLSVYGKAGLGMTKVDMSVYNVDDSSNVFSWKAGAGVAYNFNSNIGMEVGYEYMGVSDPTIGNMTIEDISSNNVVAGIVYTF